MRLAIDRSLGATIIRLAWPIVLAMLTQTAINIVDTIMVGRLPPNYSIAGQSALAYSLILLWALGGFLSSIQVGTQAIVARRYGEGNPLEAGKALTNSLIVAGVAGTITSIAAYAAMDDIFPLFDKNPNVVHIGIDYARYRMLGILSMVATFSYKSFFDGIGNTHVHMVAAIVMNVANLLLNWLLIFGVGPFPAMYVAGAGLGSLISTYIGLFLMMAWSLAPHYRRTYAIYRLRNWSGRIASSIVRVSVPSGLATVFVMTGFFLFVRIVGLLDAREALAALAHYPVYTEEAIEMLRSLGRVPTAGDPFLNVAINRPPIYTSATKIIMDIMSVSFTSMIALGTAAATLVGQNLGKDRPDLAERYGWECAKIGVYAMVIFGGLANLIPEWFMAAGNPDASVIEAGVPSLRLMASSALFIALGLILAQALFGAGYSRYVMWVEMTLHVLCLVPLSFLLGLVLDLGLMGIWSAAFAYLVLLAAAMAWKFREGSWKEVLL